MPTGSALQLGISVTCGRGRWAGRDGAAPFLLVLWYTYFFGMEKQIFTRCAKKKLTGMAESVSRQRNRFRFQFQLSVADSDSDSDVSFFGMADSDSDSSSNGVDSGIGVDSGGIEHKTAIGFVRDSLTKPSGVPSPE